MPKAGPYFLYMVDFKKEKESELGRNLSMAQVSQMASDSWNSMSEDDKAYYKEKAKGGEVRIAKRPSGGANGGNNNGGNRYTSHGVPVQAYEREERQKKHEEETMRIRIGSLIQEIPLLTDFLSHPLYFMYGNFFYKNDKTGEYSPAELAMVKFTFRDGVLKRLHMFIKPDKPALGYAFTAKAHSESTHRLTPPPDGFGEENLRRIWCEIQKFMDKDDKAYDGGKPMVFTFTDTFASEANQIDVLKSFMKQFVNNDSLPIDFYPLTRFFYALRMELHARGLVDKVPSEKFCETFLSNDPYETSAGISCDYHEGIDATRHCALSRVQRWTFLLADHFCEPLGVQLIPGTHLPQNAAVPAPSLLSMKSDDEVSVKKGSTLESDDDTKISLNPRISRLSVDTKSQDGELDQKIQRDIRQSHSLLSYEVQSIRTSSSDAASTNGQKKPRPSRASLIQASSIHNQPNQSTFYNP